MTRVQDLGSVLYYNRGPIFNTDDRYTYMSDLQGLHTSCGRYGKVSVQDRLAGVLFLPQWEAMLDSHPDKEYVDFMLQGIKNGFQIGYDRSKCELSSARKNMRSADKNAQVVIDYLAAEKRRGVLLGPFPREDVPGVHINRFGVIATQVRTARKVGTHCGSLLPEWKEREQCHRSSTLLLIVCASR